MLIDEIGKEIVNNMVGLYIDGKIIPQNAKGLVELLNNDNVIIKWLVNNESVQTSIPMDLYDDLKVAKVICYLKDHIEIPKSLYNLGDLVDNGMFSGIVANKEYSGIDKRWWYKILLISGVLDTDYDIRYDKASEDELKPIDSLKSEVEFNDKKFIISIKKTDEGEKK